MGAAVPTLQTIFSPGYTVMNLAGRNRFLADVRSDPGKVRSAFEVVTEITIELSRAFLEAGATGLFFSSFLATDQYLTPAEYEALCMPFDLQVLEAVRPRSRISSTTSTATGFTSTCWLGIRWMR